MTSRAKKSAMLDRLRCQRTRSSACGSAASCGAEGRCTRCDGAYGRSGSSRAAMLRHGELERTAFMYKGVSFTKLLTCFADNGRK